MGQDQEDENSVLDFLYVDQERIASYLSQFDQYGHLSNITKTVSVSDQDELEGGIPPIAKGKSSSSQNTGVEKSYETRWINPLALLDELYGRKLIEENIEKARYGEFVLCSGTMEIVDLTVLQMLWENQAFKSAIGGGDDNDNLSRQQRRQQKRKGGNKKQQSEVDIAMEMLAGMPHTTQATIVGEWGDAWSVLNNTHMTIPATEVFLKHGTSMTGTWYLLGILDAKPDDGETMKIAMNQDFDESSFLEGGFLTKLYSMVAPMGRFMLGRPPASYGITPILIFREVHT